QPDALLGRLVGGAREIADEYLLSRWPLLRRHPAGKTMDLAAADRCDVVERLLEQRGELLLAAGNGGNAELARRPMPGRGVEAEHRQAVAIELGLHRGRRMIIGKLQLDRLEAGGGRGGEPLDQRTFGEEISEIGGEAGHRASKASSGPASIC